MMTTKITLDQAFELAGQAFVAKRKGDFQETMYILMILNDIMSDGVSLSSAAEKLSVDERITGTYSGKRERIRDRAHEWMYETKAPENHGAVKVRDLPSLNDVESALAFEERWNEIQEETRAYNRVTQHGTNRRAVAETLAIDLDQAEQFEVVRGAAIAAHQTGDKEILQIAKTADRAIDTGADSEIGLTADQKAGFVALAACSSITSIEKMYNKGVVSPAAAKAALEGIISAAQESLNKINSIQNIDFDAIEAFANKGE